MVSATVSYNLGDWRFSLMDRWVSSYRLANTSTYVISPERIGPRTISTSPCSAASTWRAANYTAYLSVQNLLNTQHAAAPRRFGLSGPDLSDGAKGRYCRAAISPSACAAIS